MIEFQAVGGRDRDRTGDPVLAKHEARLLTFYLFLWLFDFFNNLGAAFRSRLILTT